MPKATAGKSAPALRREGKASCRPFPYHGRETTADLYPTLGAFSSGQTRSEGPGSVAHGVTSLSGASRVRTRSAASPMAKAQVISACGVATIRRSLEMVSTLLVSPTARLTYCRVHQRAWVESLDQWMAFREPTLYGSPVTEAVCDLCTASRHVAGFGEGRSGSFGSGKSA
jgi:hypothetical protein